MTVDQKVVTRFTELRELGQKVLSTRRPPASGHMTSDFVDVQLANQWLTSCQNLLARSFGEDSVHFRNLSKHCADYPKWPHVNQAFGVMLAAQDDFESNALFDVKQLVQADLFDEFLEQAGHLLLAGYLGPAAVIAGAVLEDAIRKLCQRSGIVLPDKPKLDWMNAELAKVGVYNKLMQKKVTALADIRNSAAHGKWSEFSEADVQQMLGDTRRFMESFFA